MARFSPPIRSSLLPRPCPSRGGKIVTVGNRHDVDASVGSDAQIVDLGGKTLLPGLIDSHVHAVEGGVSLQSADAKNEISDIAALEAFVAQAKSSGRGMSGDVLVVTGIPLAIWSQNAALNAHFNGGDYANQPLFLGGMDGHTGWSNVALRKRAGLNKAFIKKLPEEKRKYYGLQSDLTPNGFGVDEGLEIVQKQIPPPDAKKNLAGARAALGVPSQPGHHVLAGSEYRCVDSRGVPRARRCRGAHGARRRASCR